MGLDANKDIQDLEINTFFNKFGMTEIIITKHGQEAPPTHNHSSIPIDEIFATRTLHNTQCGYLSRLDTIGDHRCVWIDIPEQQTFRNHMPKVVKPKQCHLKMEDPCTIKDLEYLLEHIVRHDLVTKTQNILDQVWDEMDLMDEI